MKTLDDVRGWLDAAPEGTLLSVEAVRSLLADLSQESPRQVDPEPVTVEAESWRTKLWICPAETRLGAAEAAEAMGRPKSYVYARTARGAENSLPHRKLDGALTFTAGELRHWVREHEEVVEAGPMDSPPHERRLHVMGDGR